MTQKERMEAIEAEVAAHSKAMADHDRAMAEHAETMARIDKRLSAHMEELDQRLRRIAILAGQNKIRAAQMLDTFNRMGRILQSHEQRIDSIEGHGPA